MVLVLGQLPLASGAEPSGHVVCCDVDGGSRAFEGGVAGGEEGGCAVPADGGGMGCDSGGGLVLLSGGESALGGVAT